jgi:hypothetical protein
MDSARKQGSKNCSGFNQIHQPVAMLPFFPTGFRDEIFASRVSRYHIQRGNLTSRVTYSELFQVAPFALTYWVPPYLDRLSARIPGNPEETVAAIHQESTLLPLFRQFVGARFNHDPSAASTYSYRDLPRRIVGESGTTRICIHCLAEDEEEHGTPYIHRAHQIPGIFACWKHGVRLIDRCPHCRCPVEATKDLILAPWRHCACGRPLQDPGHAFQVEASEIEVSLARFTKEVLDAAPIPLESSRLVELYRMRAMELGFRRGKKVDRVGLLSALEEHVGKSLLAGMDWAYRKGQTDGWLNMLSAASAAETPLHRHLILAHFLFRESGAFISQLRAALTKPAAPKKRIRKPIEMRSGAGGATGPRAGKAAAKGAINRLVQIAMASGLGVDELWRVEYGAMRRLVKLQSDAAQVIEARLASGDRSRPAGEGRRTAGPVDSKADADWAVAIRAAADVLYGEVGKPTRVFMNSLIKKASVRKATWPTPQAFPRTRAACEELKESMWHFYARRMLWAMGRFTGMKVAKSAITEESGLEHNKICAVMAFIVDSGYQVTDEPYAKQLEKLGIPRNWQGPHPGREYHKVGRGYVQKALRDSAGKLGEGLPRASL